MKRFYLAIAIFSLCFMGCKNSADTENSETAADTTTVVNENSTVTPDTLTSTSDTTSTATNTSDATSDVKLPNKMSATTKVVPGEKGKYSLAETKWELVELNGANVKSKGRDYFINFDSKSGTFRSFVGCNKISGNYFMKSEGKIGFSNVISTRMACENQDVERNFFNNLQKVDNYMIEDDGKMLHLHTGKKAVAKFEAKR